MGNYWKPNTLFCEGKNKNLSIGRVSLWVTILPALYLWWLGKDIMIHHLYVLGFLLLYNFSKKISTITEPILKLIKVWKGTDIKDE